MHFETSKTNFSCGYNPGGIAASSANSFRTSSGMVLFVIVVMRGGLQPSHICGCAAAGCGLPGFSPDVTAQRHYRHVVRLGQASRILRRVSTDKIDNEQFAALFNELRARGDRAKLMQLFGH